MIARSNPSARAVVNLVKVCFHISGKLRECPGGEIGAGHQQVWLLGYERDRGEIIDDIVEWSLVERRMHGVGAGEAKVGDIAVWLRTRDALGSGHRVADVLDHERSS